MTPSDHHHVRAGDRHEDEQHLHLLRIGADAGHQLTDLGPIVIPEVQPLEVVEQAAAQLGFGSQRDGEGRGAAEIRERPGHECQRDDAERPLRERAPSYGSMPSLIACSANNGIAILARVQPSDEPMPMTIQRGLANATLPHQLPAAACVVHLRPGRGVGGVLDRADHQPQGSWVGRARCPGRRRGLEPPVGG